MGDATSRLLDARTAGPWAHDPPGSGTVVSTVYRGRVVAQCDRLEDADAIARSYEEWPAALERERVAIVWRDHARDQSEVDQNVARSMKESNLEVSRLLMTARDEAMSLRGKRAELDHENQLLTDERNTQAKRIAELERMLTAWQKHRHSPSLLADWTRYLKENSK